MMNYFHKYKFAVLACLFFALFSSCDKELSGFGNYAVSINNSSTNSYEVDVYVDGNFNGKFKIKAQQAPVINDCSNLTEGQQLDNIFVLRHIAEGTHRVEFRDEDNVAKCGLDFYISSDACLTQEVSME